MGLNCGCPAGAHLADLNIAECKESLGQIQKIIIQRKYSSQGVLNKIPAANIVTKTAMTALATAADGTKIIISPFIQNPTTTPGEARTFGGGNQTLGGVEIVIGREPTTFEGVIYQEAQSVIKTMKEYSCEDIGVYLIDENGNIGAIEETVTSGSTTTTNYLPIPVRSFFVGDKNLGGYEEPDSNAVKWSFLPNWSDDLKIIKQSEMDYNPLTDLVNVASA
jgi:hypothetical protein